MVSLASSFFLCARGGSIIQPPTTSRRPFQITHLVAVTHRGLSLSHSQRWSFMFKWCVSLALTALDPYGLAARLSRTLSARALCSSSASLSHSQHSTLMVKQPVSLALSALELYVEVVRLSRTHSTGPLWSSSPPPLHSQRLERQPVSLAPVLSRLPHDVTSARRFQRLPKSVRNRYQLALHWLTHPDQQPAAGLHRARCARCASNQSDSLQKNFICVVLLTIHIVV